MDLVDSVNFVECFHKISGEKLILRTEPHFFTKIKSEEER